MERVLVAGIGNVLMGDDAIGPFCVRRLQANFHFPENVDVLDLGAPGLDLTLHVSRAEHVVFVDSLRSGVPGEIHAFSKAEILSARYDARLDTHAPALEEAILIAGLSGHALRNVRLIGLVGESFALGAPLSEPARKGIPLLETAVIKELASLGISTFPRVQPLEADIWWERPALV